MSRSICSLPLQVITLLTGVVLCFAPPTMVSAQNVQVTSTPIGDPTWTDIDFHLFSAPADSSAAATAVLQSLWPLHGIGGGLYMPHEPPYDMETADGVAANGFEDKSTFQVEEISGDPLGVYVFWTTIPNPGGPTGSSRDFSSGPIVPNDVLPIASSTVVLHGGVVVDTTNFSVGDAGGFDGHSHIVSAVGTAAYFFPDGTELPGDYEYQISTRDAAGNGYDHSVSFEVIPEPSTCTLFLTMLSLFKLSCRKRTTRRS